MHATMRVGVPASF